MVNNFFKHSLALIALLAVTNAPAFAQKANKKLESAVEGQQKIDAEASGSQKKVDKVDDETRLMLDEYRMVIRKIENTRVYNQQLKGLIGAQKEEIVSVAQQIEQVKDTGKEVVPLMLRQLDTLKKFVALDLPFLTTERSDRLKQLSEMMDRADVTTSEKYRRVLEAFQVENEYGRTIEAYRGSHKVDDKELTVDFLRIGRVSLIYQSLDGDESGFWDNKAKSWVQLSSSYNKSVQKGLRIARKQSAPDILTLPIPTAEVLR